MFKTLSYDIYAIISNPYTSSGGAAQLIGEARGVLVTDVLCRACCRFVPTCSMGPTILPATYSATSATSTAASRSCTAPAAAAASAAATAATASVGVTTLGLLLRCKHGR